ncbi:hypothetical protein DXC97_31465 [Lachnospiraceae bacterium TF09-5]|nr:hypothetical protein DXC97_31465 [Lachnospiraceae bacterium TF09-5]
MTAFYRTMQDASDTAVNLVDNSKDSAKELENLTTKSQGGSIALQGLALAGNLIASWAIGQVLSLVVNGINNFIHAVDIARDKLKNSSSTYTTITSELNDLNEEFENTSLKIKEMEAGGITLIEQDEYDKLIASNDELERSIALKKIEQELSGKTVANDAVNLYEKITGKGKRSISQDQIEYVKDNTNIDQISKRTITQSKNDLNSLLGFYSVLQDEMDKTKSEISSLSNDTTEAGKKKLQKLSKDLAIYEDYQAITATYIKDSYDSYQNVYSDLTGQQNSGYDLSSVQQDALNGASDALLLIQSTIKTTKRYEELNSVEKRDVISENLQNKGIAQNTASNFVDSLTEDELIIAGKINFDEVNSIESFTQALEDIKQAADTPDSSVELSISDTISQFDTNLKPAYDAIGQAYKDIFSYNENGDELFSLENVDLDTFTTIQKGLEEIQEAGSSIDTSVFENLISVLSDSSSTAEEVQDAFNEMASSIISNLGEITDSNYNVAVAALQSTDVTNAQIIAFNALTNNTDALQESGFNLLNASEEKMHSFVNEHVAAEYASQAYDLLRLKQILYNNTSLDTEKDIESILSLADSVGFTSEQLATLSEAKARWDSAVASGDESKMAEANKALHDTREELKKQLENYTPKVKIGNGSTAGKQSTGTVGNQSSSSAVKEATDPHVTAFEEQYKKLKDIRDRDKISQKQYLDALRAMYERYYKGQDKYIDEYNKYQKEYLDGMLDLYKSVISGVVKQIDKHIKSLNDQKDSAVDSLKSQQESAKKALEAQKDAIEEQIKLIDKQIDSKQAQIDAINEENEARENAINLEKEQYELERLRNQRTEFVYSGKEKGFIYQTDSGAIRDQEQAVKEAEDQIRIANIEKEISLLEKKKEVLEEQQSAIDDQIDQVDAYYEELISNTESYWDTQIKGAEDVKSRWEELQDLKEQLELNVQLISMGISPDDISQLTSEELFEKVKEHYLGILADISSGNSQMLSSLSDLAGVDVSDLPSFLEETHGYMEKLSEGIDFANLDDSLSTVIDQFENVAAAAGMMTGSVIGSTGVSVGTDKNTSSSPGGSASGNVSFIDAVKSLEDESVPMLNNVADAFAGEESSDNSSQSIAGSVNKAKEAISGSSSGKKKSSEGQEGSGEDSGSLLEAMSAQSKAALDEETGIPAQIQKWQELNGVLSNILENLRNIAAVIPTLNSDTNISAPGASAAGLAAAKGGISNGARNVLVSEYNQLETIIHKNGTYEITSSPTLTDLRPGDQVLNNSQTLSLIRKKNRAAANRSNGLFIGNSLSPLPELQLRNTVLDHSFASPTAPQFLSNDNRNSLVNVSIGDVILENVQNADALSRQIVMRLPTQIKQELSKRG